MAPLQVVPCDLFAFGNSTKPREPRIQGYEGRSYRIPDLRLDENGMVGISPDSGASTFADPTVPGLSGHYWRLPDSTNLAPDLAVIPDGTDNGGIHSPTHHTIYPCVKMLPVDFIAKFSNLPWEYVGKMP